MRIEVNVSSVLAAIKDTLDAIADQTEIWEDVGTEVLNSVKRNFDAEGRPKKWQALEASTLLRKVGGRRKASTKRGHWTAKAKKILHGNRILVDTGDLVNNINAEADSHGVTVGSNKDYAAIHQFGGQAGRNRATTIPARPYLLLQDEDYATIAGIIEQHLTQRW